MPSGFRVADSSFDAAFDLSALRLFKISTYPRNMRKRLKQLTFDQTIPTEQSRRLIILSRNPD